MPLWLAPRPLVLASKSEVRRKILAAAGVPLEIKPADIDERGIESRAGVNEPSAAANLLAHAKAWAASEHLPERLVLGADQTLAFGTRRFSKPKDRNAAFAQLKALAGGTHELHTAIALIRDGAVLFEHVEVARLTVRRISDEFLDTYLTLIGDAALASVGAYQVEGMGAQLFERIEGDYFTILGLPLLPLLDFLRRGGFILS
ncbi:MAG TPA: Maf family protein [Pseudolabrys sp.]|nr:Maf family protein [Pseudolabrys sp.]